MCSVESEQQLENKLIAQLQTLGYEYVSIPDEAALLANLKTQLEKHNDVELSDKEFGQGSKPSKQNEHVKLTHFRG